MPNIKTFCRIKPTKESYEDVDITDDGVFLRVPELLRDLTNDKQKSTSTINHEFHFDHLFRQDSTQEQVFEVTACAIVKGFLEGFNGTIFAYGQTGTGKTYTVEGSAKTYSSRGLEPRSLSLIYKELERRGDEDTSIHVSYLEIYQDVGYDLLNPGIRSQSFVTPFPKVTVLEGQNGVCIVRNLSSHLAASEDVAQSLLLQGQANRHVAATAVHDRSSRSHAVFTIQLTTKKLNTETVIRSKLHLVDLAGSERVAKTGVLGQQLTEAKSINLSLHHLESVIVALQQESLDKGRPSTRDSRRSFRRYRSQSAFGFRPNRPSSADAIRGSRHVPYRNSLLTMLLRDSLGGNCMTAMIATISLEAFNIGESISTCRFAGRVACIANIVSRNEALDEKSLIRKLRKRIAELEAEIACLQLTDGGEKVDISKRLTEDDKLMCSEVVDRYLSGKIADPISHGITDPYKFRECLKIIKKIFSEGGYTATIGFPMMNVNRARPSSQPSITQGEEDSIQPAEPVTTIPHSTQSVPYRLDVMVPMHKPIAVLQRRDVQILKVHTDSEDTRTPEKSTKRVDSRSPNPGRRLTPTAWGDNKSKSVSPTVDGDRLWRSNSKQEEKWSDNNNNKKDEEETLSVILKREKPKSPFEQKRNVEIKKLNSKVEKMSTEKTEKEQQVGGLKLQVAEHELDMMERHMATKLSVTSTQVNDQRAYIKQLNTTEAYPALIEQERLVEKQLIKRKEKFGRQLEYIAYRREQLKQAFEGGVVEKKATILDKYGQFRKRDGSLNTRQVFQMLKTAEQKQIKETTRVDKEKVIATADLMEVKELATRQKLRDLKEMASTNSRTIENYTQMNGHTEQRPPDVKNSTKGDNSHSANRGGHSHHRSKDKNSQTDGRASIVSRLSVPLSMDGIVTVSPYDVENLSATSTPNQSSSPNENGDIDNREESISVNSFSRQIPGLDYYANRKTEKNPTSMWEMNYNRPTTPSNLEIPDTMNSSYIVPKNDTFVVDSEESKVNNDQNSQEKSNDKSDKTQTNDKVKEEDKNALRHDIIEAQSKRLEEEIFTSRKRQQKDLHKHRKPLSEPLPQNSQTFMPSEYIYGMSDTDKFDARKMGLSANTFDSALTSMLGQENTNVSFKQDQYDYDQFARTSLRKASPNPYLMDTKVVPPKSPPKTPQRSRSQRSRERHREREGSSAYDKERSSSADKKQRPKDREAGSPISAKISRYLGQTSDQLLKPRSSRQKVASAGPKSKGYDVSGNVSRLREIANISLNDSHSTSVEIEEPKSSRITATKDQDRELNFMNKAHVERDRVSRIRKARQAAEQIQRAWRRYAARQGRR